MQSETPSTKLISNQKKPDEVSGAKDNLRGNSNGDKIFLNPEPQSKACSQNPGENPKFKTGKAELASEGLDSGRVQAGPSFLDKKNPNPEEFQKKNPKLILKNQSKHSNVQTVDLLDGHNRKNQGLDEPIRRGIGEGLDSEMIEILMNHPNDTKLATRIVDPGPSPNAPNKPDSCPAEATRNRGADFPKPQNLGSRRIAACELRKQIIGRRSQIGSWNLCFGSSFSKGKNPRFNPVGVLPKMESQPRAESSANKAHSRGFAPVQGSWFGPRARVSRAELKLRLEQDIQFRRELIFKKNLKKFACLQNARVRGERSGAGLQSSRRSFILRKRNQADFFGIGNFNKHMHRKFLAARGEKRVKSQSNPLKQGQMACSQNDRSQDSIDLPANKSLSTKSEKLANQRRKIQREGEIKAVARGLHQPQSIHMSIDVNIDLRAMKTPQMDERVRSEIATNSFEPQFKIQQGFTQRMEHVFQRSKHSSVHGASPGEEPDSGEDAVESKGLVRYSRFKRDVAALLGFQQSTEELSSTKIDRRVTFLNKRGGVDTNEWLGMYYRMAKTPSPSESELRRNRLYCTQSSLMHYNLSYNHFSHRNIFDMNKSIFQALYKEEFEDEAQRALQLHSPMTPFCQFFPRNFDASQMPRCVPILMGQMFPGCGACWSSFRQLECRRGPFMTDNRNNFLNSFNQRHLQQLQLNNKNQTETLLAAQRPISLHANSQRPSSESANEQFNYEQRPWELPQVYQTENGEIGELQKSKANPNPAKMEFKIMSNPESHPPSEPKSPRARQYQPIKSKRRKRALEARAKEESEREIEHHPKRRSRRERASKRKEKYKKASSRLQSGGKIRQTSRGRPSEPEGEDQREWIEYFSQVDYTQVTKDSRAFERISKNFPVKLDKLLEFQETLVLPKKKPNQRFVDLSKLNRPKPFWKYFNPKEKRECFASELETRSKLAELSGERVQALGRFRALIREKFNIVISIMDVENLLRKNRDEDLLEELIRQRNNGTRDYIQYLKNKRLG